MKISLSENIREIIFGVNKLLPSFFEEIRNSNRINIYYLKLAQPYIYHFY